MTFTVTYRGADGALREECVEAASRSECFSQMKARGVAPLSVKEGNFVSRRERRGRRDGFGKNGRTESGRGETCRDGAGRTLFTIHCYLFVAIAVVAAIVLWWWMRRGGDIAPYQPEVPKKATLVKEVKPASNALDERKREDKERVRRIGTKERMEKRVNEVRIGGNDVGTPVTTNDLMRDVVSDLRVDVSKRKAMFENAVQAELSNYTQPGRDIPPPDRVSDEEALKAADTPIKYGFDDPVEILEQKKAVEDLLLEMKEYMRNGGHANDFFEKLQQRQEMEGEAVLQVRQNVYDLIEKGDNAAAQEALDAYNRYLQGKGIPPVRIKRLERIKALNMPH